MNSPTDDQSVGEMIISRSVQSSLGSPQEDFFLFVKLTSANWTDMQKHRNAFLALSAARFLPPKNSTSSEGSDDYRDSSLELRYLPLCHP